MFTKGELVRIGNTEGYVNFIDSAYITVCFNSYPSPGSKYGETKCCLCVYPNQWDDVIRLEST